MAFPIGAPVEHLGDTHCGAAIPTRYRGKETEQTREEVNGENGT
jgi:hypothetical protein